MDFIVNLLITWPEKLARYFLWMGPLAARIVVGWVLLELAGYFAITPFPAARRVIGVTIALGILAARVVSRMSHVNPDRRPPKWVLPFGIAVGVLVVALDTFDAFPEKTLANKAAETLREEAPTSTVWFVGHWGFQYYCERAGATMIVPGQTVLQPNDMLVLPLHPDDDDFHRPHIGQIPIRPPEDYATLVEVLEVDDALAARTIPNFYGGNNPIEGRNGPRMRVGLFRVTKAWAVPGR